MDPYRVLGVDATASREAIEVAYQGRLQQYGQGSGDEAWILQQIEEAYHALVPQSSPSPSPPGDESQAPLEPQAGPDPLPDSQQDGEDRSGAGQAQVPSAAAHEEVLKEAVSAPASTVATDQSCPTWPSWLEHPAFLSTDNLPPAWRGWAIAAGVVAIGGLLWAIGVVFVLQILLGVAVLIWLGCGIGLLVSKNQEVRGNCAMAMGLLTLLGFLLWRGIDTWDIAVPQLSKLADAQEITAAYKSRVVHLQTGYQTPRNSRFSRGTVVGGGSGSGLLLANDRTGGVIVTNRHVVDPGYAGGVSRYTDLNVRVKLASEDAWYPAKVVAVHRSFDLALVLVERPFSSRGAVRLARQSKLKQGEPVVALGNPLAVDFVTTEGILAKTSADLLLTSCPISPGNSGGPLILKRRGLVAGLTTLQLTEGQNLNGALVAEWAVHTYPPAPGKRLRPVGIWKVIADLLAWAFGVSEVSADAWVWGEDRKTAMALLSLVSVEEE
jgi:S1-C subfamily serine protease